MTTNFCPICSTDLAADAIICVDCGYHLGEKVFLATEKDAPAPGHPNNQRQTPETTVTSKTKTDAAPAQLQEYLGDACKHIFFAFVAGVLGPVIHEFFSDLDYSTNHIYSYFAIELWLPAFLLGFYFSPTARFPFRGFLGLVLGFWIGKNLINAWFPTTVDCLSILAFPTICELTGVMIGKKMPKFMT
jgi:hypothetical protein